MVDKNKTIDQFNEWSKSYEKGFWGFYFDLSNKKISSYLRENFSERAGILDVGCGTGGLLGNLSRYFKGELVGTDISSGMLEKAKLNTPSSVNYIEGDFEKIDFGKKRFDVVICMNSYHHYDNHTDVFEKIYSLLNTSGVFILLDAQRDNNIRGLWNFILKNIFDEKDVKYFTKTELKRMAKNANFEIVKQEGFLYFALISTFKKAE
jgi:ubiquinone/menaquinone biosynthesis C-methylase UbiE